VPEPVPGSGTLIPMGGWYGSPYRTHETTGAHHRNEPCTVRETDRPELTNSRKGEVSGVDKGPSNGWHLFWANDLFDADSASRSVEESVWKALQNRPRRGQRTDF